MSVKLAVIAMLIELCLGYPERLSCAIGHPAIWIGRLIGALDRWLNRTTIGPKGRQATGVIAVVVLLGAVGAIAFSMRYCAFPSGFLSSVFLPARSSPKEACTGM
jgi:adenosylcobinamide-phosphate synthase